MRDLVRRRDVLVALIVVAAVPASAQEPAVRVTREPPVVRRTEFDPANPAPGTPKLTPPESGVCNTTFELAASVRYSVEVLSSTTARVYVDGLDLTTRLSFDIYTVRGAPRKLIAHEEAHRIIGEHYYESAPAIAEDIGRRLIGATFDGTGATPDEAQKNGFEKVMAAIEQAYMARVRIPSARANARFDEITNHGLEAIDEADAIAMAIEAPAP
jgi:hypothetical protein